MPKLRAIFSRVSRPFWWPMTTIPCPSNRARPPTIAESSPAWSAAIRFSSSSRGSSKSSASGILHRDRAAAQERLDLGAELLTRVDGHSAAADHDLLRPEKEVEEQRDASRMRGADLTERGERVPPLRGDRQTDPARVRLVGGDAVAA